MTEIDNDRDRESQRDRDTGGPGVGVAETARGQLSYEDGYVYLCVFPVPIHSFEYGLPSQSLGPPSLSPLLCLSTISLGCPSLGGVSLHGLCPATGLIFQAREETLLLPKSPCPGCKGETWLPDPVPSGITARP